MLKLRTKIDITIAIALIISILFISNTVSINRTITSTSDSFEQYIRNSKGNYWENNGTNLQLAIYDLNSTNGGWVELPAGVTIITYMIRPISHMVLRGQGINASTLKLGDGTTGQWTTTVYAMYCLNINNFTLCDFSIDGNNNSVADNYGMLVISNCEHFSIHDLSYYEPYRGGIGITSSHYGSVYNLFMDGVDDYPNAQQFLSGNNFSFITFSNLHMRGKGAAFLDSMGMDFTNISWCTFTDILIENMGEGCKFDNDDIIPLGVSHNVTFNNIQFHDIYDYDFPVLRLDSIVDSSFNNVVIEALYCGIDVTVNSERINLNNIIVYGSSNYAFLITGHFVNMNNVQIYNASAGIYVSGSDNSIFSNILIRDCVGNGFFVTGVNGLLLTNLESISNGAYGLTISGSSNVSISNSLIQDGGSYGIVGMDSSRFAISNCVVVNNAQDGIATLSTLCNNYSICNNIFNKNVKAIDVLATDDYFIIANNVCTNSNTIDINAANSTTRVVSHNIATIVES